MENIERISEVSSAVEVDEERYDTARTENLGWCNNCQDFTTADVEAQEVTESGCTECSEPGVLGALRALRGGFIAVTRALLALVVLGLGASACYELGPEQHERATVVQVTYAPPTSGTGFSTSGHIAFVDTDAAYAVVFECQHGKFAVKGDEDSLAHRLWARLHVGDVVDVTYAEKREGDRVTGYRIVDAKAVRQ